ncbi:adenosylcobalamin-dependent ribonucleoside-diphosphate reductase [Gimesia panareensis]|uniref:adenosylcobalamin-dependent ribonucleoside-diphosphate reductase n=1 Tax=Gimesia panareensis TaxID=2527978 RepID=UPI0011887DE6|nr:adenosylcobalamin-dependent ribonucleoside-diphosphate reductase [Gimesia panareensis]QDU51659.1 Ribonucleoside-diphosphate reductase NrdZ [Gimesia panareensis]
MPAELTDNAIRVLEARYLLRDDQGTLSETPDQLFRRVARAIAAAEQKYADASSVEHYTEQFYQLLSNLEFLPNSPTLMNAGTGLGQLSACFVLPVEDSMADIFDSLKLMALIQQAGGGTGFSFSRLRPKGDLVTTTGGQASGPVSFMHIFDCATEHIRQGGKRRGANMGVLRIDHPDIRDFINVKRDGVSFENFNLSVSVSDAWMQAAQQDQTCPLIHPLTGQAIEQVSARELLHSIAEAAWQTGDPGMIFSDAINRANPTPRSGPMEATNPCGEVPLLPYEACNLGSINVSRMVRQTSDGYSIDWEKLARTTQLSLRFLDNVIDVSRWPDPRIARTVESNRKVGLGIMGFAELLILLEIPYGSAESIRLAEELMAFIAQEARTASEQLAEQRGPFPNWGDSIEANSGQPLRNATRTSIAPTGTIGIIAGTSAGIEPLFALAYRREHVLGEQTLVEINPLLQRNTQRYGLEPETLQTHLAQHGTLESLPEVPEYVRSLFRTALEIPPEEHLQIQSAFQRHVENAVSKTVNLPESATVETISQIYHRAWELGLKGVTVYRYGSKAQQVLYLGTKETPAQHEHFARCDPHDCRL